MSSISLDRAEAPLILALDFGTSSVRALIFDRHSRSVSGSEEQLTYQLTTTSDGGAETDPRQLVVLVTRCIDGALTRVGGRAAEIAAVGTSCFWHSLLGVDEAGDAVTPLLTWADTRAGNAAAALRAELGDRLGALHQRTGCRVHASYWPAKLRWLRESDPQNWSKVTRWESFAEFLAGKLQGGAPVSLSMASGTGLLDVHLGSWDPELLALLGITADQLPRLIDREEPLPALRPEFAKRWPTLSRLPWYPAIGDGAAANIGAGAIGRGKLALTLGTSGALRVILPDQHLEEVPPDLWAYRLDRAHWVLGGALSNGGNVTTWLSDLGLNGDTSTETLSAQAAGFSPDGHGLTMLPFLAGERSPSWKDNAQGAVVGLTLNTGPAHLMRATMEAIAYRFATLYAVLRPLLCPEHEIIANGGAILRSPLWLRIMADTLNHPITALDPEEEAAARGAARAALHALGAADELAAPVASTAVYSPVAERHARYAAGQARQTLLEERLYPQGVSWDTMDR